MMGIAHVGLGADFIDQATPIGRDVVVAPDRATLARRKARLALEGSRAQRITRRSSALFEIVDTTASGSTRS
jgi:hypothetical protein